MPSTEIQRLSDMAVMLKVQAVLQFSDGLRDWAEQLDGRARALDRVALSMQPREAA